MAHLDTLLARLDRRHRLQQVIDSAAPRLLAAALLAATAVVVVRLAVPTISWVVPACVAAGLLAPLPWLPAAWRHRLSRSRLAGELDLLSRAEGTAMALAERTDPAWSERLTPLLTAVRLPALRTRPLLPVLPALALLLAVPFLPQAQPSLAPLHPAAALVAPLRDELARLADSGVIREQERVELDQRLDELLAQAGGAPLDQATWEGVDRLQAHLDAQAAAAGEKLAAALALAQAGLDQPPSGEQQATQLAEQLAGALAALAAQAPGLLPTTPSDPAAREALARALAQAVANGQLSPAQQAALAEAGLRPAARGGAINAAQGRALARSLAAELDRRKQALGGGRAATAAEAFLARLHNAPGRGGVTRGPGSAEITREPRARTDGGDSAGLAPGATANPDGSVTIAAQARDAEPDAAARADLQRAAARAFDPAAADSRRTQVAPRHRAAVEGYFASPSAPAPRSSVP